MDEEGWTLTTFPVAESNTVYKGFTCPDCKGHRLHVVTKREVCAGVIVRYRQCSVCGRRTITEERLSKTRRPRSVPPSSTPPAD